MKVSKPDFERDNAALAVRLGFLRESKVPKVTLQSLADSNGTQRSNLSAFVTSGGKTRNIAYDKLDRILFSLGQLPDGMLAPGLHRWQVERNMVPQMCEILMANEFQMAVLMSLSSGSGLFLVVRVTGNILVFANMDSSCLEAVKEGLQGLSDRWRAVTLDRSGDSSIQAMWMTEDEGRVQKLLLSLMQN